MSLTDSLRRSPLLVAFVRAIRYGVEQHRKARRIARWSADRGARIEAYLSSHRPRALQLGAGRYGLPGWLNTDIRPRDSSAVYLDVTSPFPLADRSMEYVYSEHLIEHLTYKQGLFMLREARRVLRADGRIRIATPDLSKLIALFGATKTDLQEQYVRYMINRRYRGGVPCRDVFVLNGFFHGWGHQFVYDAEALRTALEQAGFVALRQCAPGESDDAFLRGIEQHGRSIGDDMNRFETMIWEGTPRPEPAEGR
jgi:predicted SAM-dependent methyltransferase